jgi:hypothetical protein
VPRPDHALVASPHFEIVAAGPRMMRAAFAHYAEWSA